MLDKRKYITVTIKLILTIGIFLFLFLKIPFSVFLERYSRIQISTYEIIEIFGILLGLILISIYSSIFILSTLYKKGAIFSKKNFTEIFSLITIFMIINGPTFTNFYLGIGFFLVLIILSITTILISRGLTVLCERKLLSIFIAFLNGIFSSFIVLGLLSFTYYLLKLEGPYEFLGFASLIGVIITGILSIIINIFSVVKKNWKSRI